MSITSYATLKTEIGTTLNRSDLATQAATFVQLAEAKLKRDKRCRLLTDRALTFSADNVSVPSDFYSIQSLYHNGSTYFGPIEVVSPETLGTELGVRGGTTGAPAFVSIINGKLRFAPTPDTSYTVRLVYWATIESLSDTTTTNWLLTSHPDIYLYAACMQSAPYLKHDERLGMWQTLLEAGLEELHLKNEEQQFGGPIRRQFKKMDV